MLAVDVSNYTGPLSQGQIAAWKAGGVGLIIVQAFPATYAQYVTQAQQMSACKDAGMPYDCYIYDYLQDPSWRDGALVGLRQLGAMRPARVWADEEDTTAKALTLKKREAAVALSLAAIFASGYVTGIYTGRWFWQGYMGNTAQFAAYPLWDSNYDGIPDASADFIAYGGWTAPTIKQYAGTQPNQTDLDVTA